jgi:hypothetical protein
LEESPICLARAVQGTHRRVKCHNWGNGWLWHLDWTRFLRHGRN